MVDDVTQSAERIEKKVEFWISLIFIAAIFLTEFLLDRVAKGHLFLVPFSWDRAPYPAEIEYARQVAVANRFYAMLFLIAMRVMVGFLGLRFTPERLKQFDSHRWLFNLLLIASLMDLLSTLWFVHVRGFDLEVNPGLMLITAALGPTVGPILGKMIQFTGLILIGMAWPHWWPMLSIAGSTILIVAASHNVVLMLQ